MSEGMIFLYSLFKFASGSVKTYVKDEATRCFGETELKDMEVEEETDSCEDEVLRSVSKGKLKLRAAK
jgi:hypothetical protein